MMTYILSMIIGGAAGMAIGLIGELIYKGYKRKMFRRLTNDSKLCMGKFAQQLYEIACEDMSMDYKIWIAIVDLGVGNYGSTIQDPVARRSSMIKVNPDQTMLDFIDTIFHEARHVYQALNTPVDIFDVEYINSIDDPLGYYEQPIEKDAREYAALAMKKYKRRINKLVKQYYTKEYYTEY